MKAGAIGLAGSFLAASLVVAAGYAASAFAASFAQGSVSRVWVGPKNGSWDAVNNWSPAGIPGDLDDLYLNQRDAVGWPWNRRPFAHAFRGIGADRERDAVRGGAMPANTTVVEVSGALVVDGTFVITAANDPVSLAAKGRSDISFSLLGDLSIPSAEAFVSLREG